MYFSEGCLGMSIVYSCIEECSTIVDYNLERVKFLSFLDTFVILIMVLGVRF